MGDAIPDPDSPVFSYPRRVQFHETDASGLAHFAAMPRWVEEAEHARARTAGLRLLDGDCGWVRRAFAIEYLAPLVADDEISVEIAVAACGRSHIDYRFTIRKAEIEAARGSMTVVFVRMGPEGPRSEAMPEAWRKLG